MKKSYADRLKITKNGKIVRMPMGVDHFRAKRSGKVTRAKRKTRTLAEGKIIKKLKSSF